jgi:hypothetical protein
MEKEMKELCIEGLAIHGGPESCGGVREDAAEALTGVCAGRAIEPRKGRHSGCRRGSNTRKATSLAAFSRAGSGPRGVGEPVHARDLSMRENREVPRSPACGDGRAGRAGKAEAVIP